MTGAYYFSTRHADDAAASPTFSSAGRALTAGFFRRRELSILVRRIISG